MGPFSARASSPIAVDSESGCECSTEMKNYEMNSANKCLTKHKSRMEGQSRKINKITIDGKSLTNSDKIKEGIQRYYKFQFRCQCKNEKRPKPCAVCKTNPVQYANIAAKNFKKRTHKQRRITNNQKEKLEQKLSLHEIDDYILKKLKVKMKSLGPDGIPYEFFNVLWKEIRSLVYRIMDWIFTSKKMPESMFNSQILFQTKELYELALKNYCYIKDFTGAFDTHSEVCFQTITLKYTR